MKQLLIALAFSLGIASTLFGQEKKIQSGEIAFQAINKKEVSATTSSFNSLLNLENETISITVPIANFSFKNKEIETAFSSIENMNASLFPVATFKGKITANTSIKEDGRHIVQTKGNLTIKGITIPFSANGLLVNKGTLTLLKATFLLDASKYGLTSEKVINFSDKIEVSVNATY